MSEKLTDGLLYRLGFRGEGRDFTNNPAYRFEVPRNEKLDRGYHYQIQIVLNNYPESNGNSGILSLYAPPIKDAHCITEEDGLGKVDFVQWETEDQGDGKPSKGGIKYINVPERNIPIAWHVTTLERLNEIYVALTQNDPLIPRPKLKQTP
jgi:hypothetical protein